jgi:hypothetical protein
VHSDEAGFLVFTENDVNCCVDITSTKDFKYITVNSNTRTSSEEGFYFNFSWAQYQIFAMFRPVMSFFGLFFLIFVYVAAGLCDGIW